MLLTSPLFLLLLPGLLALVWIVAGRRHALALPLVLAISLAFYLSWSPRQLLWLLLSIAVNYALCRLLATRTGSARRVVLTLLVVFDLAYTATFKYFMPVSMIPLGMSFFVFQQIAYAVGIHAGKPQLDLVRYSFVVTFFPHVIAGPLVQHRDVISQLAQPQVFRYHNRRVMAGLSLFLLGLAKKLLLAEPLAPYASGLFTAADLGHSPDFVSAWLGCIACAMHFYFDFSGYSDMASGLALTMGIRLPMNFFSPWQARSLDDFWRRWNMTLSAFLAEHLMRPVAGRRFVRWRHVLAVVLTSLIAGAWHGNTVNFAVWGLLNGLLIAWLHLRRLAARRRKRRTWPAWLAQLATLGFVIASASLFGAHTLAGSRQVMAGLVGLGSEPVIAAGWLSDPVVERLIQAWAVPWSPELLRLALACVLVGTALAIVLVLPNAHERLRLYRPVIDPLHLLRGSTARPWRLLGASSRIWLGLLLGLCFTALLLQQGPLTFNYFNF